MSLRIFWIAISIIALPNLVCAENQSALSAVEQHMVQDIHQNLNTTLTELEQAVNINSGSMNFNGVKAVGNLMLRQLSQLGFDAKWHDGSAFNRAGHVVATYMSHNPDAKKVLMIGHLDTVFAQDDSFQKFSKISETEIAGPGITDMKGGNAIIIASIRALKNAGILDDISIKVVMTGDEESSGRPLSLSKKAIVDASQWADVALGFEDGDSNIKTAMVARRGYTGWTLKVSGKPAHSSQIFTEQEGFGAIFEAARILNAFREQLSSIEYLSFNPGVIAGGTRIDQAQLPTLSVFGKSNVIAQTVTVSGDLRALTAQQVAHAKQVMQTIVKQNLAHTQASIEFETGYPPMAPSAGNRQLLALYSQVSQDLGYNEVVAANPRKAGAADISFAANKVDMALDGLGLMGRGGHTKDEVADITSLAKNIEKTTLLLYRLSRITD
ncbi:M20/M25/M40 family metallo-hydrolase [Thalassotalea sp. G2M2-11]|uniref:M20/M25/M40 family metallo-hydrolase n=1 Tax=Thalassotalea sp. G2M2-11 TaxID=2787627 RepID=UPI0019D2D25D|nr:M20/M25/M40 family metallo-hydrolase [Thalassotalea sp. G2M2-11]